MDQQPNNPKIKKLTVILICSAILFLVLRVGLGFGFNLFENDVCLRYLGCTGGFLGFDILVHFSTGIFEATLLLWLVARFPRLNILQDKLWKNVLIIVAFAALVGVGWEIWEFGVDHFRIFVLHQDLLYPKNLFMQANNNSDTMGDLIFGLLGAVSAAFAFRSFIPGYLKRTQE